MENILYCLVKLCSLIGCENVIQSICDFSLSYRRCCAAMDCLHPSVGCCCRVEPPPGTVKLLLLLFSTCPPPPPRVFLLGPSVSFTSVFTNIHFSSCPSVALAKLIFLPNPLSLLSLSLPTEWSYLGPYVWLPILAGSILH